MKIKTEKFLALGIDTSAYTTSLAIADQDEKLIIDQRKALPVKAGKLGLRQSEAVFAHLSNLPMLLEKCQKKYDSEAIVAVATAAKPRPVKGSYMPVFKVGEAFGSLLARTMGFFYLVSTHQEGHVMAGLWSAGAPEGKYLVLHLSGGTTEIISSEEYSPGHLKLTLLGGSSDLNAGQFIDRIGQAMGLPFPSGPALEQLARNAAGEEIDLPVAVKGCEISFSGPASQAERLLQKGCDHAVLGRAVEKCIADSLCRAVSNLEVKKEGYKGLLTVGGVTANRYIKDRLANKLEKWDFYSSSPDYASDNAAGMAVQAARTYKQAELVKKE
ncbi:MAG: O-sialoglycoprotein endopeptidase [Bacillota bacterium]